MHNKRGLQPERVVPGKTVSNFRSAYKTPASAKHIVLIFWCFCCFYLRGNWFSVLFCFVFFPDWSFTPEFKGSTWVSEVSHLALPCCLRWVSIPMKLLPPNLLTFGTLASSGRAPSRKKLGLKSRCAPLYTTWNVFFSTSP